jgi:hypothetical protein
MRESAIDLVTSSYSDSDLITAVSEGVQITLAKLSCADSMLNSVKGAKWEFGGFCGHCKTGTACQDPGRRGR